MLYLYLDLACISDLYISFRCVKSFQCALTYNSVYMSEYMTLLAAQDVNIQLQVTTSFHHKCYNSMNKQDEFFFLDTFGLLTTAD